MSLHLSRTNPHFNAFDMHSDLKKKTVDVISDLLLTAQKMVIGDAVISQNVSENCLLIEIYTEVNLPKVLIQYYLPMDNNKDQREALLIDLGDHDEGKEDSPVYNISSLKTKGEKSEITFEDRKLDCTISLPEIKSVEFVDKNEVVYSKYPKSCDLNHPVCLTDKSTVELEKTYNENCVTTNMQSDLNPLNEIGKDIANSNNYVSDLSFIKEQNISTCDSTYKEKNASDCTTLIKKIENETIITNTPVKESPKKSKQLKTNEIESMSVMEMQSQNEISPINNIKQLSIFESPSIKQTCDERLLKTIEAMSLRNETDMQLNDSKSQFFVTLPLNIKEELTDKNETCEQEQNNPKQENKESKFEEIKNYSSISLEHNNQIRSNSDLNQDKLNAITSSISTKFNNDDKCSLDFASDLSLLDCQVSECHNTDEDITEFSNRKGENFENIVKHYPLPSESSIKCNDKNIFEVATQDEYKKNNVEQLFFCSYCDLILSDLHSKQVHEIAHIKEKLYSSSRWKDYMSQFSAKLQITEKIEKPFVCNHCGKSFAQLSSKVDHEATHAIKKQQFLCKYCKKPFLSRISQKDHEKTHTNINSLSFQCKSCGKSFKQITSRDQHEENAHSKLNFCKLCGKSFNKASAKIQHEKDAHSQIIPCRVCGKLFAEENARQQHEANAHSNVESILNCKYCGKSYLNVSARDQHEAIVHLNKGKLYNCEQSFCEENARDQHEADAHALRGNVFNCKYCGTSFPQENSRDQHEVDSHPNRGEKFFCKHCGKIFSLLESKEQHEKVHSQKPFFCSVCLKCFSSSSAKNQHEAVHGKK